MAVNVLRVRLFYPKKALDSSTRSTTSTPETIRPASGSNTAISQPMYCSANREYAHHITRKKPGSTYKQALKEGVVLKRAYENFG